MGEINYSTRFIKNFVTLMHQVLVKHLQTLLYKPLPCTGKTPLFEIFGDKGTIKRDVTQPILICTVSLQKDNLFQKYYLIHPELTLHKGEDITELLLSTLQNVLGWPVATIQERFCNGSFDGQYINLKATDHILLKKNLQETQ